MKHWMNAVKRKIAELEGSDQLIFRFVDFRYAREYFLNGTGLIGAECIKWSSNFSEFNKYILTEANYKFRTKIGKKEMLSKTWGEIASRETNWSHAPIDSFSYYHVLNVYRDLKKKIINPKEREMFFYSNLNIDSRDLQYAIEILEKTRFKDYTNALKRYRDHDFDINDGKFIDLFAEAIAFVYNVISPLHPGPPTGLKIGTRGGEESFKSYSMIIYINPRDYISRPFSVWGSIDKQFTDDLILGVQVLVPKISQVRRVIWDMLEATEDHPYSRAPVYNLMGKLVWPTKEELSQTY